MIKLVVSDIDGTLVRSDKSLSDGNVAAIKKLVDAGLAVTLISARPASGMKWIVEKLGLPGPFGAFNGGTLFTANDRIDEQHWVDADLAAKVLGKFAKEPVIRWAFTDGQWLSSEKDDVHTPREIKSAGVDPVFVSDFADRLARIDKLVAVTDDSDLLDRIEDEVRAMCGDQATVARSQTYYLDVTAPAGNKGDGIAALARAYGAELGETVAFGDQANDLPMFALAGLSVAMGQAPDKVKAKATEVAKSNDENGVADAIDRFVLPKVSK